MRNSLSRVPAYIALRLIAFLLAVIALALLSLARATFLAPSSLSGQHGVAWLTGGLLLLVMGVAGPVRIIRKGAQIPAEIRRTILVQALVLPLTGVVFITAGMVNSSTAGAWAYGVAGLLTLASAIVGFYALSTKLPRTFYLGDMLGVIKSVGITGDKAGSPADREFTRWTNGLRDGVPPGAAAPDGTVITMEGQAVRLSSYFGGNPLGPLVLNFGSYTCPHHRKRLDELQALMDQWAGRGVRFLTVYTAEAHPVDGWSIPHQYDNDAEYTNDEDFCFYYARSIDDRSRMARWLIDKKHFKMPMVLDAMDDSLLKAYNSWPIRLYIITAGKVAYCGEQGPFGYDPGGVDRTLRNLLNESLNQSK